MAHRYKAKLHVLENDDLASILVPGEARGAALAGTKGGCAGRGVGGGCPPPPPAFVTAAAELEGQHALTRGRRGGGWRAGGCVSLRGLSVRESAPHARSGGREKSGYRPLWGPRAPCACMAPTHGNHSRTRVCDTVWMEEEGALKPVGEQERQERAHEREAHALCDRRRSRPQTNPVFPSHPTVIATLGPACRDVDVLKTMLQAGMSCARVDLTVSSLCEGGVCLLTRPSALRLPLPLTLSLVPNSTAPSPTTSSPSPTWTPPSPPPASRAPSLSTRWGAN